jgi:hypothetical protein
MKASLGVDVSSFCFAKVGTVIVTNDRRLGHDFEDEVFANVLQIGPCLSKMN